MTTPDGDLDFDLTFEHQSTRQTPPPPASDDGDRRRDHALSPRGVVKSTSAAVPTPTATKRAGELTPARVAELQAASGGTAAAGMGAARLSPIVSADTEALMRRLVASAADKAASVAATPPVGSAGGVNGGYFLNVSAAPFSSSYNPSAYGSSPSFADLALTKTAESLAASTGIAVENANGVIVYGEAGTPLQGPALLELVASLRLTGEVQRHWLRDGQHFCFFEFAADVDVDAVARRITGQELDAVKLTCEPCSRITPGRDPRTHNSASDFKNSTLVLKNVPFQLRQEMLAELLSQLPVQPISLNYHYDATGAFRGMAFVKYATVDDAFRVFDELNGLDIMGRALRVEYKRRGGDNESSVGGNNGSNAHAGSSGSGTQGSGGSGGGAGARALDPNELAPEARAFYDQLMAFKNNARLTELAFPPSLTVHQRKQLHFLSDHIGGLAHGALGDGSTRFLVVSKVPQHHDEKGNASASSVSGGGGRSWKDDRQQYMARAKGGNAHSSNNNSSNSGNAGSGSFTGGASWGSRGRKHGAADVLSQSPKSFASMLERDATAGSESVNVSHTPVGSAGAAGDDGERVRRVRGGTGGATETVNVPVRQPRGPDGTSGFHARAAV